MDAGKLPRCIFSQKYNCKNLIYKNEVNRLIHVTKCICSLYSDRTLENEEEVDQEKVQNMIQEQLIALQNGDFTTETLSEVQDSLINQYRAGHDLASNVLEQQLVTKLVNESDKNFITEIKKVTVADVMRVAKQMKLQAVYLLSGEK